MPIKNISKVLIRRASDGKYLVLVGSKWPERPDRSQKPDLPGGLVEAGETFEQGCVREVKEEAGIDIDSSQLVLAHAGSFTEEENGLNRLVYYIDISPDPKIVLSWEHESYSWLTAKEVLALDIREPYPQIFRHMKAIGLLV